MSSSQSLTLLAHLFHATILVALGGLVKEPLMCVPPLYYSLNTRRWLDLRLAARTLVLTLPAVAAFVALRVIIPGFNNDPSYLTTLPLSLRLIRTWSGDEYDSSYWDYSGMVWTIGLTLHLGKYSGRFSELVPVELLMVAAYLLALLAVRAMLGKREGPRAAQSGA